MIRPFKILFLLVFVCIPFCKGFAQIVSSNAILNTLEKGHPRLFANNKKIISIKLQNDEVSKKLLTILKAGAEKIVTESAIIYPNGKSNFATSRNVQGRVISLAMAYRLFGDKRYVDKAKAELLQLAALEDWGTAHFLDLGEAALAAGIGFDWLYSELSESERTTIVNAIKNKALIPGLNYKEGIDSWVNGNFNWNPVCHGGLTVGALAIAEFEPESAKIINRAIKNIPIAGEAYSPDGAFAEGPSYWSYGTSFYVLTIEALRSALGNSFELEKIPGFLQTANYKLQMRGATNEEYNYSDYHVENLNEPIMIWFARELNQPDLVTKEIENIHSFYEATLSNNQILKQSNIHQNRHTPLELLWWNPQFGDESNKRNQQLLQWTADGLMSIGVMRSAWNDSNATFVAIKGGTPNNSHGHMDAGSFVLESNGVRWAVDLGTESYDKMRAAKLDLWNYTQNSSRWTTFRVGPDGHNIPRFNKGYQLISGNGKVKQLPIVNGSIGNETDLSSLYQNKVNKVTRTILLHQDKSVDIQDEWITKDSSVDYSFQWLTRATITKTKEGLLLQQNGKYLYLNVKEPRFNNISIAIENVSTSSFIQDSNNPGLSRIVFKTTTSPNSNGKILILATTQKNKIIQYENK